MLTLSRIRPIAIRHRTSFEHHYRFVDSYLTPTIDRPLALWTPFDSSNTDVIKMFDFSYADVLAGHLWTIVAYNDGEMNPVPRCFDIRWPRRPVEQGREFKIPIIGRENTHVRMKCTGFRGRHGSISIWNASTPFYYDYSYRSMLLQ